MTGDAALADASLRLFDAAGGFLSSATGYGQAVAEILYTATTTGTHYLYAAGPTARVAAAIR